jgi:hypothetical protein
VRRHLEPFGNFSSRIIGANGRKSLKLDPLVEDVLRSGDRGSYRMLRRPSARGPAPNRRGTPTIFPSASSSAVCSAIEDANGAHARTAERGGGVRVAARATDVVALSLSERIAAHLPRP